MATCHIHTGHHQPVDCYRNANLKI